MRQGLISEIGFVVFWGAPLVVFAKTIPDLIRDIKGLVDDVVKVVVAVVGLVFLWGVFKFVTAAGDEKARGTGKQFIIWGLVGLAVMFAFWGLVTILIQFLGAGGSSSLKIPSVIGN